MADLLLLAHRMPFPPEKDGRTRSWHVLRHLAERHRVHLGCFYNDPRELQYVPELEEHCASLTCLPIHPWLRGMKSLAGAATGEAMSVAYFRDVRLMRWIAETFARWRPTEAFVFASAMVPYLDGYRFATRMIDMADVGSEKWHQRADESHWPISPLYRREAQRLRRVEIAAARNFDYTLFESASEASLFLKRAHRSTARVLAMRNGIDYEFFDPARAGANPYPAGRKTVVLAGSIDGRRGAKAAHWFITEVMTALRHRFPAFDFWVLGGGGHTGWRLRSLGRGDVRIAGRVDDIRPYLAHADAVVAPGQMGRGVQARVLEAMALAKPVIATPDALQGLNLKVGEEVLAASNGQQFANTIARLFGGEITSLGLRARSRVIADYSWPASLRVLDAPLAEPQQIAAAAS